MAYTYMYVYFKCIISGNWQPVAQTPMVQFAVDLLYNLQ